MYKNVVYIFFQLHIVHVKEGLTVEAAKNVTDGLAVLGIFFVVGPQVRGTINRL